MKKTISDATVAGWGINARRGWPQARASSLAALLVVSMAGARVLGLLAVLTATGNTFAKPNNGPTPPAIRVCVQDYAQVGQETLEQAEQVTAGVLEFAGIQVSWINCPAPECKRPPLTTDLPVRILPQSMADLQRASKDALGSAHVSSEQDGCEFASVFYDRVKSLAHALRLAQADILGYVMAHELGHLLLRSSSHAYFGIMRAHWTGGELLDGRSFTFMPAQARLMRANVSARMLASQNRPSGMKD